MSNKSDKTSNGNDAANNKGESQPGKQKGAESVSKKNKPGHKKDESDGAKENTTKKQSNSI